MKIDELSAVQKNKACFFALLLFVTYFIFSALIPPFQSPDEYDHVKRSYLLANGRVMLESPEGRSSGGPIDSGLLSYIHAYQGFIGKPDMKLSSSEVEEAETIRWTGEEEFASAPGTGYYFPLVYVPQALGLKAGQLFSLSVDQSYRLARLSTLLISSVILFFAFRLYTPSLFALALLLLPMSIFQMASTSLDVFSTALAILTFSMFMNVMSNKDRADDALIFGLAGSLFLLVSSKINLLPLIGLLVIIGWRVKSKKSLVAALMVFLAVALWFVFALHNTVDMRVSLGATTSSIIFFYLRHPFAFFDVLGATLPIYGVSYINSFIGALGWLDAPLHEVAYKRLYVLIICAFLVSISFKCWANEWPQRGFLIVCAIVSSLLVFFALLITWSAHPAQIIEGVQGRYFLIPMLMLAYAFDRVPAFKSSFIPAASAAVLALMFLVSTYSTAATLMSRFYLVRAQPVSAMIQMQPSPQLSAATTIKLGIPSVRGEDPTKLRRIGVLFATYARFNLGVAELRLTAKDGSITTQRFDLADVADNQFRYFDLNSVGFLAGEIISISGGGISVWESKSEHKDAQACIVYDYVDGRSVSTPGCPR
ncbi:DUF2142 domain-containing protein [Pseudomonas moraviensis]|uniref:DUF2142 domain-containing protein n=1 Tax=Pseudomonas moraviensis TaxID=321662 RepID=UPI00105A9B64|nr:DUF2142 domain-containing protein [Pseudomonas moraviensis]TDK56687.1 DUF2142 domain-containing protein [Pseudomonas moraviensis]